MNHHKKPDIARYVVAELLESKNQWNNCLHWTQIMRTFTPFKKLLNHILVPVL